MSTQFDREVQQAINLTRPQPQPDPEWWAAERDAALTRAAALSKILLITGALGIGTGLGLLAYAALRFVFGV